MCRIWTEDELSEVDPLLHQFTDPDRKLQNVYGDTVHANDGLYLSGRIDPTEDRNMQRLYFRVAGVKQSLYGLPSGQWANRFLDIQTQLWKDV